MLSVLLASAACLLSTAFARSWNQSAAGPLPVPQTPVQESSVPRWTGFRNASLVGGLTSLDTHAFWGIDTANFGFTLPSRDSETVLPLEQARLGNLSTPSGSVWVTLTIEPPSSAYNASSAYASHLRQSISYSAHSPLYAPWFDRGPFWTGTAWLPERWDALEDANTAMQTLESRSWNDTEAAARMSGSGFLPTADGACHGLDDAELRHNASSYSSPIVVGKASQFASKRQATGATSVSMAGTGRPHIGHECFVDHRDGTGTPNELPHGSSRIDAAFLILVPSVPPGLQLAQAELLDHALYRPRVAGSWVWSPTHPRAWRPWPGARARIVLPLPEAVPASERGQSWAVGIQVADGQGWPRELRRAWPANSTAPPAAIVSQAFAEASARSQSAMPPPRARLGFRRDAIPPVDVAVIDVASAGSFSLALLEDGSVKGMGSGSFGQHGNGQSSVSGSVPANAPWTRSSAELGGRAVAVSAGGAFGVALLEDGTLRAFGYGGEGQLGYGATTDVGGSPDNLPSQAGAVQVGARVAAVSAGDKHTIALLADGNVRAWGHGPDGRMGFGFTGSYGTTPATIPRNAPYVPVGMRAVAVAAGESHSLVILRDGTLRSFGVGDNGRLGHGSTAPLGATSATRPNVIGQVPLGGAAVAISAGDSHSLVLLDDGTLRAFGAGAYGRLGYGATDDIGGTPSTTPALAGAVPAGGRVVRLSAGSEHSVVVLEDGSVRAFGNGRNGRLGYGTEANVGDVLTALPWMVGPVPIAGRVLSVSAGWRHSHAVLDNGTLVGFGLSAQGQIGTPVSGGGTLHPVQVVVSGTTGRQHERRMRSHPATVSCTVAAMPKEGVLLPATAVSAGVYHSLVVLEDGTIRAFGWGTYGRLGYGSTTDIGGSPSTLPWSTGAVPLGGVAVAVSAGDEHSLVVLADGTVRAFGRGSSGRLGYGSTDNVGDSSSTLPSDIGPVDLGGFAVAASAGSSQSLVLLSDGTVRPFGSGYGGALGYGSGATVGATPSTVPRLAGAVAMGGPTVALSGAAGVSAFVLADGTLRVCGWTFSGNGYGNTDNVCDSAANTPDITGPVPLGGFAVGVAVGLDHVLVVMEDGTLRAFGSNFDGQLGYPGGDDLGGSPDTIPSAMGPVPVSGRIVAASATEESSAVLLDDGTVRVFGGDSGRLVGLPSSFDLPWQLPAVALGGRAVAASAGPLHWLFLMEDGTVKGYGTSFKGVLGDGKADSSVAAADALWAFPSSLVVPPACAVHVQGACDATARAVATDGSLLGTSPSLPIAATSIVFPRQASMAAVPVTSNSTGLVFGPNVWPEALVQVPTLVSNLFVCPTGEGSTDLITGATLCEQPDPATAPARITVTAAGIVSDGVFTPGERSGALIPSGGRLSATVLQVEGDFAAAAVLESIRDDRIDAPNAACSDALPAPPTLTVWVKGCDSRAPFACWERQASECEFHSTTAIWCRRPPPGHGAPGTLTVEVRATAIDSFSSSVVSSSLAYAPPVVEAVIPAAGLSASGGDEILIQGTGFGAGAAEVPTVLLVGIGPCGNTARDSDARLRCTTPAGVGSRIDVQVSAGGQSVRSSAANLTTGYAPPRLAGIAPSHILAGVTNTSLVLFGDNLAIHASQVDAIVLGGAATCGTVRVIVPGRRIECSGINAPARRWPSAAAVNITIAGQSGSDSTGALFRGVDAPSIDAIVVLGPSQTVSAGATVRIVGTGFGFSSQDLHAVLIGGKQASFALSDPLAGFIEAVVPPGAGEAAVQVVSAARAVSEPSSSATVSYGEPTVTACVPPFLLPGSGGGPWNLSIIGSGFDAGLNESFAAYARVSVGGLDCDEPVLVSPSEIRCVRPSTWNATRGIAAWWPAPDDPVRVTVAGLTSARVGSAVLSLQPVPRLLRLAPTSQDPQADDGSGSEDDGGQDAPEQFPTRGGTLLALETGGSLVAGNTSVANITVRSAAGAPVPAGFAVLTAFHVLVVLPPGTGAAVLTLYTARGLSASIGFVYDAPAVLRVDPPYLLAGNASAQVVIHGVNLGLVPGDFGSVTVGGAPCSTVTVLVPSTAVLCAGLNTASTMWPDAASSPVTVRVGGVASPLVATSVFEPLGMPSVSLVTPTVVGLGEQLTVSAASIGRSQADVSQVLLTGTATAPCENLLFLSPTSLGCRVPASHPLWQLPPPDDASPAQAETLELVIVNRHGARSAPFLLAPKGRSSSRRPVDVPPWDVRARRPVGVFTTLQVQWRFASTAVEDALTAGTVLEAATAFRIQVFAAQVENGLPAGGRRALVRTSRSASSSASLYQAEPLASATVERVGAESTGALQRSGLNTSTTAVFRAEVTIGTRAPVVVVVTAVNDFGAGLASLPSQLAAEGCTGTEYLDVRGAVSEWACAPCPAEAACAGLPAHNVTALAGFWRLPWASLRFAACSPASACLGRPQQADRQTLMANATDALDAASGGVDVTSALQARELRFEQAVAVPGAQLRPASQEGCGPLRRGVLCASCVEGSFRPSGSVECVSCGGVGEAWARSLGIGLLMLAMLTALIWRATAPARQLPPLARGASPAMDALGAVVAAKPAPSSGGSPAQARSASLTVQTGKIVFTHLQTVAIVGGVQLQWPEGIAAMFSLADAGSSFSTEGLSIDCLLGQQDAVARTAVTLGGAVILVLYVMSFWAVLRIASSSQRCTDMHGRAVASASACMSSCVARRVRAFGQQPAASVTGAPAPMDEPSGVGGGKTTGARPIEARQPPLTSGPHAADPRRSKGCREPAPEEAGLAGRGAVPPPSSAAALASTRPAASNPAVGAEVAVTSTPTAGRAAGLAASPLPQRSPPAGSHCLAPAKPGCEHSVQGAMAAAAEKDRVKRRDPTAAVLGQPAITWWRRRAGPSLLVLSFLLHAIVSKAAMRLLACQPVGPDSFAPDSSSDTQLRLVMDLNIRCDDPGWTAARLGVALPVLVLFGAGLPVGTAWALRSRKHRFFEPEVQAAFGFMYRGFDPKRSYAWESVIMSRKFALAAVTVVLAASGPTTQAIAGLSVVMMSMAIHAWVKPYSTGVINRLEMTSLVVAGITLFCAGFMGIQESLTRGAGAIVMTVIVLSSNLAFLATAAAPAVISALVALRTERTRTKRAPAQPGGATLEDMPGPDRLQRHQQQLSRTEVPHSIVNPIREGDSLLLQAAALRRMTAGKLGAETAAVDVCSHVPPTRVYDTLSSRCAAAVLGASGSSSDEQYLA